MVPLKPVNFVCINCIAPCRRVYWYNIPRQTVPGWPLLSGQASGLLAFLPRVPKQNVTEDTNFVRFCLFCDFFFSNVTKYTF